MNVCKLGIPPLALLCFLTLNCQNEKAPGMPPSVAAAEEEVKTPPDPLTAQEPKQEAVPEAKNAPINHVNEETRTEVHPAPQAEKEESPEAVGHTCGSLKEPEIHDPLPFLGTIHGSEIIHTPKGSKPPWQMIFSKDYVAVQGVHSSDDDAILAVCSGTDELILVDTENPAKAKLITSLRPSAEMPVLEPKKGIAFSVLGSPFGGAEAPNKYGRCEHIARDGDTLYFSHRQDQFRHHGYVMAYDLSGKKPKRKAHLTQKGESYSGLAVGDDFVAVAAHTDGVLALSKSLTELGRFTEVKNAWDVAVEGSVVYVAAGTEGLFVLDFATPDQPKLVKRLDLPGFAKKVERGPEDSVYVALGPAGFAKISTKRKKRPSTVYVHDTPGTAVDLSVHKGRVAVADWTSLRVYEGLSKSPTLLAAERTGKEMGRALAVTFRNDAIFVGDWTGVHVYEPALDKPAGHLAFDRGIAHLTPPLEGKEAAHQVQVMVKNDGEKTLEIGSGGTRGKGFTGTVDPFTLTPGATRTLPILFDPQTGGEGARGELVLCVDDPGGPEVVLPLRANPPKFGAGKPIPNVGLRTTDKKEWALADHAGKPVLLTYFATF